MGVDERFRHGQAALDDVVQAGVGTQAQRPGDHGAGQVGIDHQGAEGMARERARHREDERRSPFGAMATGEKNDFQVLALLRVDECVCHPLKPIAPFPLEGEYD